MVLLVLLVIGIGTVGAQVWTSSAPANYQLRIPKNEWSPGYQAQVKTSWLFNKQQIKTGEKYELEITFKSNRAFTGLNLCLVDGNAKVNYWGELSAWEDNKDAIAANTEITRKYTFTTIKDATSNAAGDNMLVFDTQGATQDITLTFSKFTFTRVQ